MGCSEHTVTLLISHGARHIIEGVGSQVSNGDVAWSESHSTGGADTIVGNVVSSWGWWVCVVGQRSQTPEADSGLVSNTPDGDRVSINS